MLVECATHEDVDLVVMGSRGLSPMRELLIGSPTDKALRACS
jgi:nucleotide-binding universal stress UspA family protein